ncbi:hypothetical protein DSM112329_03509 [Paraconexibacter sp. AEG42_29]|uniref:Uncharacterized protein n=1 Tax=Paraconexibacter sp. AEG42_29 TaxID=2997339 RepID=A0AAU7AYE4_9ACTN
MTSWEETDSPHFAARHDEADSDDVVGVLELLEGTRRRLARQFPVVPELVNVVLHGTRAQLYAAQPELAAVVRLTNPAARRYVVGWPTSEGIHLLAPRHVESRASNVPGSREMALLAPAALYAQVVVGANNPQLPPPFRTRSTRQMLRWAWLWAGAGQYFGGQTVHARPAIARRLREGAEPSFPPAVKDAMLLGGSVLDLLAQVRGEAAVVELACRLPDGQPERALEQAFGQALVSTGGDWRAHLARIAGQQ